MRDFPKVLEQVWMMDSADICVVGEHIGYNWNSVCTEIAHAGFYAQDGAGSFTHDKGDETGNQVIDSIMREIFANNPGVECITITNND